MNKFTNPLENIKIASPCEADWNEMIGNERRRFCGECQLNVYNLSGMSRDDAENLLLNSEGRVCVRFYKRADGTVLTKDCPVGWRALKQRVSKTATAFASLIIGLLSALGLTSFFSQSNKENVVGRITIENSNYRTMGAIAIEPTPVTKMGKVAVEYKGEVPTAGGISNLDDIRGQVKQKRRR